MLRITAIAAMLAVSAAGTAWAEEEATDEQVEKIMAFMDEIGCEMDPDDIEVEDEGGFDLDDVQCPDGQYDIALDAEYQETGRRKE